MADEKQGSGTGAGPTEGTPMAMGMAMCSEMLNTTARRTPLPSSPPRNSSTSSPSG
jgi:hypothetical protein